MISAESDVESAKISLCDLMNVLYDKNMAVERFDATAFY
jgi:hypothetical protein